MLTGNSTEFLDPVFSSGVAFATESGMLAAKLVKRQLSGEKVDWEKEYTQYMKRGIDVFTSYVREWLYRQLADPLLPRTRLTKRLKKRYCSVLAGYVWDESNVFVKKHATIIKEYGLCYREWFRHARRIGEWKPFWSLKTLSYSFFGYRDGTPTALLRGAIPHREELVGGQDALHSPGSSCRGLL